MGVEYVYDSRTTDFADQILADTNGEGRRRGAQQPDQRGFIEATVRATAKKGGRFAEIAKRDIWTPEQMAAVRPDIDYGVIALDVTMMTDPTIRTLMTDCPRVWPSANGRRCPPRSIRSPRLGPPSAACSRRGTSARSSCRCPMPLRPRADRSYLITGGLGALGLHTAAYLAQLGAGDIVVTSRRGPDADEQRPSPPSPSGSTAGCVFSPMSAGVGVAACWSGFARVAAAGRRRPPGGRARRRLLGSRIWTGSAQRCGRDIPPITCTGSPGRRSGLFILYSSASACAGARPQANYACANALLDGLVAHRRGRACRRPPPTSAPWGSGGMATSQAAVANLSAQGMMPLEPTRRWRPRRGRPARNSRRRSSRPTGSAPRRCSAGSARRCSIRCCPPRTAPAGDSELLRQLQEIPVAQRVRFITEFLQREVQGFLRSLQPPASTSRFLDLGTDSLMAVELRNRLFRSVRRQSSTSARPRCSTIPTIGELAAHLVSPTARFRAPDAEPPAGWDYVRVAG